MNKDELKPIDTSKYKITETGQVLKMTKDEMKNRISMALKDPVLQQGFEIICKENAELVWKLKTANEQKALQLYKAKEILRKFIDAKSIEETCVVESEAEQLLNEYEECFVDFKEKWHDLRKDPSDIPNDARNVWTNVGSSYYDSRDNCWRDEFGRTQGVIAWCEPKFEE